MNQPTKKETIKYVLSQLSMYEKVLLIAQTVLSIAILVIAISSMNGLGNTQTMYLIALILLIFLLIVNGLRLFPKRKISSIMYFIVAVLITIFVCSM